jgi:hypothetical protein
MERVVQYLKVLKGGTKFMTLYQNTMGLTLKMLLNLQVVLTIKSLYFGRNDTTTNKSISPFLVWQSLPTMNSINSQPHFCCLQVYDI